MKYYLWELVRFILLMRGVYLFGVILLLPILGFSQGFRGKIPSGNYWGIGTEVGLTRFYGDVDNGAAPGGILRNNKALKVLAIKNYNSLMEISGRISFGQISGQKPIALETSPDFIYFNNNFIEYSIDVGVNVVAIFSKKYRSRLAVYASVGVGLIDIKTKLFLGSNDSLVNAYGANGEKATTEFVLPIGIKGIYHISQRSAVLTQLTLSRVDTDKLDALTGNNNRDYYHFLSVGYIYKFSKKSVGRGIHH